MFTITITSKNPRYLTDEILINVIAICEVNGNEVTITCEHENAAKVLDIINEVK